MEKTQNYNWSDFNSWKVNNNLLNTYFKQIFPQSEVTIGGDDYIIRQKHKYFPP